MSKEKSLKTNDGIKWDTPETPAVDSNELNNEIFYNCSECSSMIEIISIDEENNTIEFNCLNQNNNHSKNNIISLNEYLNKMKKYNNSKINKDECEIHKNKYISFCFDCNCHLCKECLKTRNHLSHRKNNIIEIEPMKEELNIINEVIIDYENKIDNLNNEKIRRLNKLKDSLNNNKKSIQEKYEEIIERNEKEKENEFKINHTNYITDINKIVLNCQKEIKLRKDQYLIDNNKSIKKFKLMNEKENMIYKKKIIELTKKYNEDINNKKLDEQILNLTNIKRLDEIILNTYNMYNNNYYNAININSILLRYIKNDYIKNKIKNILKDNYDEIFDMIQRKNKVNINIQKEEENKINKELQNLNNEKEKLLKLLKENDHELDSENLKHLEIKSKEYGDENQLYFKSKEYENPIKIIFKKFQESINYGLKYCLELIEKLKKEHKSIMQNMKNKNEKLLKLLTENKYKIDIISLEYKEQLWK